MHKKDFNILMARIEGNGYKPTFVTVEDGTIRANTGRFIIRILVKPIDNIPMSSAMMKGVFIVSALGNTTCEKAIEYKNKFTKWLNEYNLKAA